MKTCSESLLLVLFFALLSLNVFAEGTPTVAPNAANITALLSAPDLNSGPYFNAPEDNRVKFTITNNATQNLYFGFDWRQYAAGSPPRLTDIYWRIRRSSDLAVVAGPTLWNSALGSVGSIDTHAQALAGPNIAGSVPAGYNPIVFDPTQDGEYFIEIYRSSDGGVTGRSTAADRAVGALFDLTVANNFAPYTKFNGRVNSDKWGFVAVSNTYGNLVTANAEPVLYGYTNDQTIVRLDFETGFQPIAFNVALNSYGVTNVGSWLTTRRSRNDVVAPGLTNGYRVFLNVPDATLYPVGAIPTNPTFLSPAVTGCGPYLINYNVSQPGDVRLLLDLNGVPGFQNVTADRVLEALDVLAGNNSISWDGLNGLGVAVPSGTNLNLALTFLKGRFNLPLYDAELNRNGIRIGITAPIPIANAQMYWDDSALTNVGTDCTLQTNNQTGAGINNSILGTISPAHAWSGDGNLAQTIPAPVVAGNDTDGNQCTDFGNVRTINTWGWGYTSAATNLNIVLGCANLGVNKIVSNATPSVGSNVTFTITASNAGPTQSPNTIVNDLLSASCYTFVSATPSVGTYDSITGEWSIGTLASGANATLSIIATVISQTGCVNTATISGDQEDPTPANNTSTVTPVPFVSVINAVDDAATLFNGSVGGTTALSVLANDTLNAVPANLTTVTLNGVTVPAGLTLNPSGTITVAPGTPAGNYSVIYEICEVLNPSNCDQATAFINVATIDAINDTPTPINGTPGGTTPSVLVNDTLNGLPVVLTDVTLTPTSVPTGLTLNPDGTITVDPNTPAGTYPVVYEICQVANPTVCDTATANVVVTTIDAVNYTPATIPSATGGTTPSVLANDTLNGLPVVPTDVTLTPTSVPAGLTLNPDGTITVAPGTPNGTYPVVYEICQVANPTVCDTATASVVVAAIDAVDDTPTPINGTPGGSTPSVLANDTLNGLPLVPTDVTLTPTSVPAGLTLNPDGTITVDPNTPAGTYPVVYTICEIAVPTNCDTATASVVVTTIDAVDDTPSVVNGTTGATVPTIFTNDTLDGVAFVPTDVTLTSLPLAAGLTLNADGTITVAPGTAAGSYPVTYTICQVANPTVCDTAVTTIVVATIDAINDSSTPINGTPGGSTPSVLANDTLDGSPLNPTDATLTTVSVPAGLTLNPDGTITVAPGTAAGTYPVVYEICQVAHPTICDTATASVVVTTIDAVNDTPTPINGTPGGTTPSVLVNDTLNGLPVVLTDVTLTPTSVPTGLTLNPDGTITVDPNTPAGTYPVVYEICQVANPTVCDTATANVVVTTIDAVNDTPATIPSATGGTTPSVLANDTLNELPIVPTDVTLTPTSVTAGLTLNTDGTITVAPGTPSGTYPVVYEICQVANPTVCDTATASVVVAAIDAVDDTPTPINGTPGGITPSVLANDTLNGLPLVPTDVTLTPTSVLAGLTLNPDGTITVDPNTPAGTYPVDYTICEIAVPTNCDTATSNVVVTTIDAVNDTPVAIPSALGGATPSVLANDTLDGLPLNPTDVTLTPVSVPAGLTLNPDGTITVAPGTPNGTYPVVYEICQVANPTVCDIATASVIISEIDAVNDNPTTISSGGSTSSVLVNDILNGLPVVPSDITLTPVSVPVGLTLNPDGTITVASNVPSGTYPVIYTICEIAVPTNCDTATATVVVLNPIDAVDDNTYPVQTPSTTVATTVGNVTVNDTLNGVPVTASNTDVTPITTGPLSIDADGVLTLAPNTTSGTYTITYQLCEVGAVPTNCDTATATVVVLNPTVANDDTNIIPINGYDGGIAIPTVLVNDTLNGVFVNASQVTITLTNILPSGITFNTLTGQVGVNPQTAAGTYTFTYNLCEVGAVPANCDPATVTVVVSAAPINAENDDLSTNTINGYEGGTPGNIFVNNGNGQDTLNNSTIIPNQVTISVVNNGGIVGLSIANNGDVIIPSGTPAGNYIVTYSICEVLNPTNCDQATITIVITAPPIDAIDDLDNDTVNSEIGATIPLYTNDTLNQDPLIPIEVTFTLVDNGGINGAVIDSSGNLIIPAGTPIGTYTIVYQICDIVNPNNCDTAIAIIVVKDPCDFDDSADSCDIVIYNYLSPGNDTNNEYFILEGIEKYPDNSVEIYNRWGVLVYDAKGYDNNTKVFRGISEGRVTIKQSEELPEGTYFYIIKYTKTSGITKEKAGYLYINRK
ncbi:MAG: gliding motility-associated C-terminal domain-containing protein [Flavobacterium sp.]